MTSEPANKEWGRKVDDNDESKERSKMWILEDIWTNAESWGPLASWIWLPSRIFDSEFLGIEDKKMMRRNEMRIWARSELQISPQKTFLIPSRTQKKTFFSKVESNWKTSSTKIAIENGVLHLRRRKDERSSWTKKNSPSVTRRRWFLIFSEWNRKNFFTFAHFLLNFHYIAGLKCSRRAEWQGESEKFDNFTPSLDSQVANLINLILISLFCCYFCRDSAVVFEQCQIDVETTRCFSFQFDSSSAHTQLPSSLTMIAAPFISSSFSSLCIVLLEGS